jgi:multidrug resistance efflux pump
MLNIKTLLSELASGLLWLPRWMRRQTGRLRFWVCCLGALLLALITYHVLSDRYAPLTTDAYVQAYVIQLAPEVAGRVVRMPVREGELVKAGDLLFEVDPRPFEQKVALLEARLVEVRQQVKQLDSALAAAKADHERVQAEMNLAGSIFLQERQIFKTESTTERRFLEAQQKQRSSQAALLAASEKVKQAEEALAARIGDEHALVAQVKAQLALARLDLAYTQVHAPCDGMITDLQLREGAYVHIGQPALTLIDTRHWLVVANFRENSLLRMQAGQPALVALQGMPGQLLPARVLAVGGGVSQGQGVPNGMLPDVKRTTSWIPPSQRFQVRLELSSTADLPLRVGMTGSASVYVDTEGPVVFVTEVCHKILSWIYYL